MAKYEPSNRLKYARYLDGWTFEKGIRSKLDTEGSIVLPLEYTKEMEGNIFCPVCATNLTRVPKDPADHFSNNRKAHFRHQKKYKSVKCDLRVKRSEGKRYDSYEEARKAIDDENLVIVSGFMQSKPECQNDVAGTYDQTPVEDEAGPVSSVPIGRHTGEAFQLPSKITTVAGICRNFDRNLYKYYYMPGRKHAIRLIDLLKNIEDVLEEDQTPRLYWGRIKRSFTAVEKPKPTNIRMTELEGAGSVKDFFLKTSDGLAQARGIDDDTTERVVLVWGKVTRSGIGLCIERLNWGEVALLPPRYDSLLEG